MKATSAALKAHNAQGATTLVTCWKVTRRDGAVFGFTEHVRDLPVSGVTYQAATGFSASAIRTTAALNVDNLDVEGKLDAAGITEADLLAGRWDFAEIHVFEVNYADLTMGIRKLRRGYLGEVKRGRAGFVVELRGLTQKLAQQFGRVYTATCNADLGDARCAVALAPLTVTGALTAAASGRQFTDSARGEAAGWFKGGKLSWTGGANAGLSMEVKDFAGGGVFTLQQPMPFTVAVGDAYSVTPGCDKTIATCHAKFGNTLNFRGFPHVPGTDRMISGR